jgi:uncharacterized protein (TIGR02246 family)
MLSLVRSFWGMFGILMFSVFAFGQAQGTPEDTAAIKGIVQGQAHAWNRGDAATFAARYSENGTFTNVIGQQIYGKAGFVAQHERIFSTIYKGSHNEFTVDKVLFLRQDVAVVNIDGVLKGATRVPPGLSAAEVNGEMHVKLQEVMTKEKDGWWIAAFHNVAVMPLPPQPQK